MLRKIEVQRLIIVPSRPFEEVVAAVSACSVRRRLRHLLRLRELP